MSLIRKIIVFILIAESKIVLAKYKPTIIAITGSVGKTSTKNAIYSVLKNSEVYVRKSDKSFNTEIGLPLTIIGIPNAWKSASGWLSNILTGLKLILRKSEYPSTIIVEVGADHPGDISSVAKWLRPHIAVITKISPTPVHVEFFSSPDDVFEEKASLAENIRPGGHLVLFADEPKMNSISERVSRNDVTVTTFGISDQANVRGAGSLIVYENQKPIGMNFIVIIDGHPHTINLKNIIGESYIHSFLAAIAVGRAKGITVEMIAANLNKYNAPPGRMNLIQGINDTTIIDDSYNSSPDAVIAALDTLKNIVTTGAKIAVLGDMMELGKYSGDQHREIGRLAVKCANIIVTVGPRSRSGIREGALSEGMPEDNVRSFATSEEASAYLKSVIKSGDVILIKGSQSIRTEKVVKALMKNPEDAKNFLARQEKEWLDKK